MAFSTEHSHIIITAESESCVKLLQKTLNKIEGLNIFMFVTNRYAVFAILSKIEFYACQSLVGLDVFFAGLFANVIG